MTGAPPTTTPTTPLAKAATLPSRYYLDPDVLEAEEDRIFGRTWQLVARGEDLARAGDFVPANIVDEPIVITRGAELLRLLVEATGTPAGD